MADVRPADGPDHLSKILFAPRDGVRADNSIFGARTDVFYVNGINTTNEQSEREAQTFATLTHKNVRLVHDRTENPVVDGIKAIDEAAGPVREDAMAKLFAREIWNSINAGHTVHIGAFSRGAIITENAIKIVDQSLRDRGHDDAYVKKFNHDHFTLETFNGFSHTVAPGIDAVNYVNTGDYAVGNLTGMGANAQILRNLVVDPLVLGVRSGNVGLTGFALGKYVAEEGILNRPNGPIINVEPNVPGFHPIEDHNVNQIFESKMLADQMGYEPFPKALATYGKLVEEHQRLTRAALGIEPPTGPSIPTPPPFVPAEPNRSPGVPSDRPGHAPSPAVYGMKNGIHTALEAGSSVTGHVRSMGAGMIAFVSRDGHGHPTAFSLRESELLTKMSPPEQREFREAIDQKKTVTLDFELKHDKLEIAVAVTHDKSLAVRPDHTLAKSRHDDRGHGH